MKIDGSLARNIDFENHHSSVLIQRWPGRFSDVAFPGACHREKSGGVDVSPAMSGKMTFLLTGLVTSTMDAS